MQQFQQHPNLNPVIRKAVEVGMCIPSYPIYFYRVSAPSKRWLFGNGISAINDRMGNGCMPSNTVNPSHSSQRIHHPSQLHRRHHGLADRCLSGDTTTGIDTKQVSKFAISSPHPICIKNVFRKHKVDDKSHKTYP